ncbi:YqkE family protein [Paenibacillus doosanensis]|uniref:YqkE family protein n=1 Tax=Paenibacillus doosanensis TaxID=1229154 RepID=UPI0021803416|nr:YqkE family protein [Paenibacillus doosanensis]MCS7462354.1 YqkE family protein [Paenibacillus doosanensis]
MVKKRKPQAASAQPSSDKPATLKDLLNPDVLNQLKAQADQMRAAEAEQREKNRKQAEEARKAEQKRREKDFGYLLEQSSMDWRKYK